MKKTIFVVALSSCLLMSGCSGVSQEEYDSAVSENSQLESEKQALEEKYNTASANYDDLKEKYDKLSADYEKLEQDNQTLKEENELLSNRVAEAESSSQETVSSSEENAGDYPEQKRDYVLSLKYGSYKTENGSIWYLDAGNTNSYITYPEDLGYAIDDKVALNIFSDMVDVMVNGLQVKSLYIPMASFFVCEPDGDLIATAMPMIVGESISGMPLTFYGNYEYLNDTEAALLVQSAWNSENQ